jgi:hypothetical protein
VSDYTVGNDRPNPSEDDVAFEEQQGAAGLDEGDLDPAGAPVPAADRDREPVGRVQGQDTGFSGEQGADARASGDIGGAAGGRS